ncbi:chemotaxis protein CheW [Aquipuribacter hungaricus]|uniref:chemotaxis protein CheW n=1 Tax=Aquipuribacter hungaricus TaxID=545624 RepID=UPI0030EDDC3E
MSTLSPAGTQTVPGPGTLLPADGPAHPSPPSPDAGAAIGTTPEAAADTAGTVFGLLRVQGIDIALPLAVLREVVPCPQRLDPLPTTAPAVLGAMHLRRTVLPVVDLGVLLDGALEAAPGPTGEPGNEAEVSERFVVVVAHAERLVGLLVDELRGVGQVPALLVQDVRTQQGALLLSGAFHHADTDRVVSVLDVGVLLQSTGIPTIPDRGRGQSAPVPATSPMDRSPSMGSVAASPGRPGQSETRVLTLVRAGEHALALDVAHVHTTLPRVRPTTSVLTSELCLGVVEYAGLEVPVVDPLVLLGLGRLDRVPEHTAGLVMDLGTGYVVMALDELVDLQEVDPGQVLPVHPFALPAPELFAGLLDVPGRPAGLVLDGQALLAHSTLLSMASVNVTLAASPDATPGASPGAGPVPGPGQRRPGGAGDVTGHQDARPHLAYECGVRAVTPLEQVSEVVPYQAKLIRTGSPGGVGVGVGVPAQDHRRTMEPPPGGAARPGSALLGLFAHRGAAVPVLDLSQQLGLGPCQPGATACLLLVRARHGMVGFVVGGLDRIETVAWADPEHVPGCGPDAPSDKPAPTQAFPATGPGRPGRPGRLGRPGPGALPRPPRAFLQQAQLVRLGQETQLLPRLDLRLLASAVENGALP